MIYKYDENNKKIIRDGFNVVNIFNEKESKISYSILNLDGNHGTCINNKSIKYWIILEGNATVYINDEPTNVTQGDFIIIDKNIKHNIIGKVKFGVVCEPPFDKSSETFI